MKKCSMCGAEFIKQGQLNLHMYHCKRKHSEQIKGVEEEKEIECSHKWRLLNLNSEIEKKAYQNNYMEVCSICQELR